MNFADRWFAAAQEKGNPCVVGLDPRPEQFPESLRPKSVAPKENAQKIFEFHRALIDTIAPLAPAVKPQIAFFERYGHHGWAAYEETIAHAHTRGLLVIGDAKRGDIGSTAEAYAQAHLGEGPEFADALTVNPFFGTDGVKPFLDLAKARGKGLFFLVKTSNPSSAEIQDLKTEGGTLVSERVASLVRQWGKDLQSKSGFSATGAVVGATHPSQIANLRKLLPEQLFLLPGYGAQGGKASDLAAAFDAKGRGGLVTSSRGIAQAYGEAKYKDEKSWERACEKALREMIADVNGALAARR